MINKGNYSLDTVEREELFNKMRGSGVDKEYIRNRREWAEYPGKRYVAEYPLLVDLELSSICNLRCPFCYTISDEFKKKVNAKLMDFKLFRKVIDEIGSKVFAIRLSLRGEPTLHPDFLEAIIYAKKRGIGEVSVLTNGGPLTPELFEKAMDAGLDWITLSFDGLRGEYENNRRPLKFEVMYDRLLKFKEMKAARGKVKPVIKIQSVWPAISGNPSEFYETMSCVSDLVAFNPLIDFTRRYTQDEVEYEDGFSCPQIYQRLVVGADGLVMTCANDEENECVVGDANKQTIYDIWHGKELSRIRETHSKRDGFMNIAICRKCYLPRKTREDKFEVCGRELIVRNYI